MLVDEDLLVHPARPLGRVVVDDLGPIPMDVGDLARFRRFLDEIDPDDFDVH